MNKLSCYLILLFLLTSCVADATPTEVAQPTGFTESPAQISPTATNTVSPTLTMTPTPDLSKLTNVNDFSQWVDDYVRAFGGEVTINDISMNASELTEEILMYQEDFTVVKDIDGVEVSFIVVNNIPIALKKENNAWQETRMKNLGTLVNLKIGCLIAYDPNKKDWWGNEFHIGVITLGLSDDMPDKNTINFDWPDYQIEIADANGLEKRAPSVLFPGDRPKWVEEGFTQEDLNNMVKMIVEHMKEKDVDEIIVVNEAAIPKDWIQPDIYWLKYGIDYVIQAFSITREIFPEAKLIYNDTNNHMYGSLGIETTKLIANALHKEGLIDYVGVEMHMPGDIPNKEEIIEIFQSYPVPVVITEFDALLTDVAEDEKDTRLNEITKAVFDACLESQVCHSITFWGKSDSNSWGERSTLRDTENNRKQAYYIGLQSMFEHIP